MTAGTPVASPPDAELAHPGYLLALLRAIRPRQWTKNLVVFAPLMFAKSAFDYPLALRAVLGAVAFCLLASGIYVLNDWVDREKDRLHPEKRRRPIAAGHISGQLASGLAVLLWGSGTALAYWLGPTFMTVAGAYVGLQFAYSFVLKRLVILDVMTIATGFVLRVVAGSVVIGVAVSNWLFLCTLLLAVFLGFAKRRAEISALQGEAGAHRSNLDEYSLPLLDQMMAMVAAVCILGYGLYTVSRETIEHVGSDRLKFTVPFVVYGIFRYLFLVHRRGLGGSPERVLLSDVPLIIDLLLFVGVSGWALYT